MPSRGSRSATKSDPGVYSPLVLRQLSKRSPWLLDVFDKLLFEHISDAVLDVTGVTPPYNPYLYESLMADVSRLLDRCLAYRRECSSLEGQAVSRALDYDLFTQISINDADLNDLLGNTQSLQDFKSGQSTTAANLDKVPDSSLAALAPSYASGALATQDAITNQTKKAAKLSERLKLISDYQKSLQLQYTTTGHALNYAERRDRVVALIKQDVAEAYQKAVAARAGLGTQLGVQDGKNYPFPIIVGNDSDFDFLDRFVLWARDILRMYELYGEDEIVFDLVIPVASPYYSPDFANPPGPNEKQLYATNLFKTAMSTLDKGGLVSISLKDALPKALKADPATNYYPNVRLRGLGISAGIDKGGTDPSLSWSATIFLPAQPNPYAAVPIPAKSKGKRQIRALPSITRPPVVLGRISPYRYDVSPATASGEEVWNADISADNTQIYVQPMALQGGGRVPNVRDNSILTDLKIHLKIAARASNKTGDWSQSLIRSKRRGG